MSDDLHGVLTKIIKDTFYDERNRGGTMDAAADNAAARVLSVLTPTTLRLQTAVEALVEKWQEDRKTYPTGEDPRAAVADNLLKLCIQELEAAVAEATRDLTPQLEDVRD